MKRKVHSSRLSCLVLLFLQSSSFALRNYEVQFDEVKCVENKDYIVSTSCSVSKILERSVLNIDVQMKKEVPRNFIDVVGYMTSAKRKPITFVKIDRMDYCALYKTELGNPLINVVRDTVKKFGNPPETCPIAADYHYHFANLTVDPEVIPAVFANMVVKVILSYYESRHPYFNITVVAKFVNKNAKNKVRKGS